MLFWKAHRLYIIHLCLGKPNFSNNDLYLPVKRGCFFGWGGLHARVCKTTPSGVLFLVLHLAPWSCILAKAVESLVTETKGNGETLLNYFSGD